MSGKRRDDRKIEARERAKSALTLRRGGASYEQIASHLGVTRQAAHKLVTKSINAIPREEANDVRTIELSRLDAMLAVLWPKALADREGAVDKVLRIMKRRAEYLGLDEPKTFTQVNVLLEKELNVSIMKLERGLDADTYQRVLSLLASEDRGAEAQLVSADFGNVESEPGSGSLPE